MFNFILPQFIFQIERWKWNKEYRVYVSNLGNFKNEHKQPLPVKISSKGYCSIKTECGLKYAHRIVMLTWCPIPNAEELTVDHLNHNKRDNSVKNLEWVTSEENQNRAKKDLIKFKETTSTHSNFILKAGKKRFSSYEEAAEWLMKTQHMSDSANKYKIIAKIQNAEKNQTCYCGRRWKRI